MKLSRLKSFAGALLLVAAIGAPHAQPAPLSPAPPAAAMPAVAPAAAASQRLNTQELAAYVDGVVESYQRRFGIAGVTVAVVDAQGPLLLRGYGIASQDPPRPVSADRTLFRIGSVSKTFTYLETLKLIDAGKLKLDAPVNDYLPADLKLPDDGYKPVLLRHLLTHTAGYEDSAFGHLFAKDPKQALSLHDYLQKHRPARVREAGTRAVYSNYSVALLGEVLSQVSGVPFEALIERDLFAPMGMSRTTFREPLGAGDPRDSGAAFKGLWSTGHQRSAGGFEPKGFEYIAQVGPAGAVSSNAADMSRYLRMLLNRGELDGRRIVPAEAFAKLEGAPLFRNAPDATGLAYGFFRRQYGQVHGLEHGGATLYFHSNLLAVPELGFGVFVSTNTDTGARLAAELPTLLLQHYFERARPAALPKPAKDAATALAPYLGKYLSERRNHRQFEKLLTASNGDIGATKDGYLTLSAGGETSRWVQEKADVFRAVEGPGRLVFLRDKGAIVGFVSPYGHDVLARAGVFDTANALYGLLALSVLASLGVLTGAWLRRRASPKHPSSSAHRGARWLTITAIAWLLFVIAFGVSVAQIVSAGNEAIYSYPTGLLRLAVWLGLLPLLLSLLDAALLWPVWRSKDFGVWRKLRHTLVVAIFLLTAYAMWRWNVIGWKL
ncbi:serine hydrolase domain-containing protein [Lysobacter capsici]|uniref:serine hydrolase domain-containing protein n=1 Tax=Lysobacter capsici TaxID=435897 RepID=UPI00287B659E|nr:serine hydrolase domain-containing protein [Lysobacter capsici]WND78926.1 serine hydrolase domain-containing protein [Lysobacter capsici]WND84121.1 serine hydrolase domain-containing protein [Lysobacter capsici]